MIVKHLKNIKGNVREILLKHPECRDDDQRLICTYYYKNFGGQEYFGKITGIDLLKELTLGNLPFPDSITRMRRLLQQKCPDLRGKRWSKRKTYESETRENIHNI